MRKDHTKKNHVKRSYIKKELICLAILVSAFACMIGSAELLYGKSIYDGETAGSGHSWAGNTKSCTEEPFTLRFTIWNLEGGMNVNINMNGPDRYGVGFINLENGSLATYLFKQTDTIQVDKQAGDVTSLNGQQFSSIPMIYNQTQVIYNQTKEHQVELVSDKGHIQVFIYEAGQEKGMMPAIDYYDFNPLPPGRIDFENLENSSAEVRNIVIACAPATDEKKPPNLGVGHFKPPG